MTSAGEPAPEWHAVWRYRLVMLVVFAVLAAVTVWLVNQLLHAADQNPANEPVPTTAPTTPGP